MILGNNKYDWCSIKTFYQFCKHYRYGLCYVFNFVLSDELDQIVSSNSDGPDYGLSLIIDIEKSQYMRKGLSSKEGLIIALASPSEYPNLLSNPLEIGK